MDRAFFRDVLGFRSVDAGEAWLIFALPSAEAGVHPSEGGREQTHGGRRLLGSAGYFMCDDLEATIRALQQKKVECTAVESAPWGSKTTIRLPSGGEIACINLATPPLGSCEPAEWHSIRKIFCSSREKSREKADLSLT